MVSDKTPNQHMVSKFLLNQIHIDAICCRSFWEYLNIKFHLSLSHCVTIRVDWEMLNKIQTGIT